MGRPAGMVPLPLGYKPGGERGAPRGVEKPAGFRVPTFRPFFGEGSTSVDRNYQATNATPFGSWQGFSPFGYRPAPQDEPRLVAPVLTPAATSNGRPVSREGARNALRMLHRRGGR